MVVHSACPPDYDCTECTVEGLILEEVQRWEGPCQDLVAELQAGRLMQGHCRVRRGQGIPHPGEHSWADHSQAEAGHKERP